MDYQVIFKDDEGRLVTSPVMDEKAKEDYIKNLGNLEYKVREVEEKLWQLVGVVFDLQLIPAAKKAVKAHKMMKGLYTFGDPNKLAKKNTGCVVECTTGEHKIAYVVAVYSATASQIKAFKTIIGYDKLGLVIEQV